MHAPLFVFEFLGTTELLVIALVALVLFGPRKLPEIGRQVGKSIAEFKRASDDFKRTWEFEVEMEQRKSAPAEAEAGAVAPPPTAAGELGEAAHADAAGAAHHEAAGETVARTPSTWQPDGALDEGGWDVATGHAPTATPDAHASGAEISQAGAETSQVEPSQAHARKTSPANEEINAS
ncbi:MAG TPA: twin-arginine translocase TatA/TatE family subunit [Pyrinomonadaceae bacterium]|nr:twin-arginine translocase TatA/TatE family subunit [Pyrinomonadaceae bacterium]